MGKKDKAVDAIVKEDVEVMTTQDEGVIPNAIETKDEEINKVGEDVSIVERPDLRKADEDEIPEDGKPLEKEDENEESRDLRDEDAVFRYLQRVEKQNVQLKGAVVYLVKSVMTPADIEDFKALFPGLV